ncbi:MAG: adenylate kinase [Bacilli bacterium]|nr:adenylate kinase [Bacilli bacterium]
MNIIFVAPPAAGKGTQSALLVEKYGVAHISTGDLLRAEVNKGSELGKSLQEKMSTGELIADDIVIDLLKNRLMENDIKKGFILDGFPRNLNQAHMLDEMLEELNMKIDHVLYLDMDKELAMHRALGRMTCPNCGKGYNKYEEIMKPKVDGKCDDCQIDLESRSDDNEETFNTRFDTYLDNTQPLLDYYKEIELLNVIDNSGTPEDTFKKIEEVII